MKTHAPSRRASKVALVFALLCFSATVNGTVVIDRRNDPPNDYCWYFWVIDYWTHSWFGDCGYGSGWEDGNTPVFAGQICPGDLIEYYDYEEHSDYWEGGCEYKDDWTHSYSGF